jgi:hypothetical protein
VQVDLPSNRWTSPNAESRLSLGHVLPCTGSINLVHLSLSLKQILSLSLSLLNKFLIRQQSELILCVTKVKTGRKKQAHSPRKPVPKLATVAPSTAAYQTRRVRQKRMTSDGSLPSDRYDLSKISQSF